MKSLKMMVLAFVAICFISICHAQSDSLRVKAHMFTIEGYTDFNNYLFGAYNSFYYYLPNYNYIYGFKVKYYLSEKLALRASLSGNYNKTPYLITTNYAPDLYVSNLQRAVALSLRLGMQKHFRIFKRLSPYYGGDLLIALGNGKVNFELDSNKIGQYGYNDGYTRIRSNSFGIAIAAFLGTDFYIYKNLYIGTELGISLGKSYVHQSNLRGRSANIAQQTSYPNYSTTYLNFIPSGLIRFGFAF
jgi:hypothetical protein